MVFNRNTFNQSGGAANNFLIYAVVIALVFFLFIMPMLEECYKNEKKEIVEKLENVMIPLRIDTNKCSRSCCVNSGWPYPKELNEKDMSSDELNNYIPTNLSCNFGSNNGGGCVCVKKEDYEILGSRAGNGVTGCNN